MQQFNQIMIMNAEDPVMEQVAKTLCEELRTYRIPGSVQKTTGLHSMNEVSEPWLILICTQDTPTDPAIIAKIEEFTSKGLYSHILTILAAGTPEESFPEKLLHETLEDGTVIEHEPLAANIVSDTPREMQKKLKVEKLRLLAPVLGVSFDELRNRRRRQRQKIFVAVGIAVLAAAAVFMGFLFYRISRFSEQNKELNSQFEKTLDAKNQAEESMNETERAFAASIGVEAQEALKKGDTEIALLLCLEMLPERQDVEELTLALEEALVKRTAAGYVPVTAIDSPKLPSKNSYDRMEFLENTGLDPEYVVIVSEAEGYVYTDYKDSILVYQKEPFQEQCVIRDEYTRNGVKEIIWVERLASGQVLLITDNRIYDIKTGELLKVVELPYGSELRQFFSSEGNLIRIYGGSEIIVFNPFTDVEKGSFLSDSYPAESVHFIGEVDPVGGLCSSSDVYCDGILFTFREEAAEVPENLEDKIQFAKELLNGRELTEEERSIYRLQYLQ